MWRTMHRMAYNASHSVNTSHSNRRNMGHSLTLDSQSARITMDYSKSPEYGSGACEKDTWREADGREKGVLEGSKSGDRSGGITFIRGDIHPGLSFWNDTDWSTSG